MILWRKPATAAWHYESAECVDHVDVSADAWTGDQRILLDGTKDKSGTRHTALLLKITESDVEKLYRGLQKGRKAELRRYGQLTRRLKEVEKIIADRYREAEYGSREEKAFEEVLDKITALL